MRCSSSLNATITTIGAGKLDRRICTSRRIAPATLLFPGGCFSSRRVPFRGLTDYRFIAVPRLRHTTARADIMRQHGVSESAVFPR